MRPGMNAVPGTEARHSANPRQGSEAIIGKKIDPQQLLDDLPATTGVDTAACRQAQTQDCQ